MPWNESNQPPGGRQNGGPDRQPPRRPQQEPPDFDEVLRLIRERLNAFLGGGKGGKRGGGGTGGGSLPPWLRGRSVAVVAVVAAAIWAALGFYTITEGRQGVELRFGKFHRTTEAGWHWRVPLVDNLEEVDVQNIRIVFVGYRDIQRTGQKQPVPDESLMLTQDENIIDIQFAVQYDIKDSRHLLFNVTEPPDTVVRQATESAVREIVGRSRMDDVLTTDRDRVASEARQLLQQMLDRYQTGINIRALEAQDAQPPGEVKEAFDDVVKAREDKEREINKANAYANDVLPRARGAAVRIIQEAEAYRAQTIARAQGEGGRFSQVLTEYQRAPDVTRTRLYLESLEEVFSKASKVLIDQEGGNNILYLPIDQLVRRQNADSAAPSSGGAATTSGGGEYAPEQRSAGRIGRSLLP